MERSERKNQSMVTACYRALRKPANAQQGLLQRAVIIAAAFGIAQAAGLRQWVSALLDGPSCGAVERIGCCTYLFLYGCIVFVAPVLTIAAVLLMIWNRVEKARTQEVKS